MSAFDPGDQFVSEEELRILLEQWKAAQPSNLLDQRVVTSYYREVQGQQASDSQLMAQDKKEEVAMKFCSTCREEFADKFSFCPVDGTPLSTAVSRTEESIAAQQTEAAPFRSEVIPLKSEAATRRSEPVLAAAGGGASLPEFHLTIMDDSGLVSRLAKEVKDVAHEYQLTWPEFKRDPFGFTKRLLVGYGQMASRFFGNRNVVIAMGAAIVAMAALVVGITLLDRSGRPGASRLSLVIFALVAGALLVAIFSTWFRKDNSVAVAGAPRGDSQNAVLGMLTAFAVFLMIGGGYALYNVWQQKKAADALANNELVVENIIDIPNEVPTPDPKEGAAGFNKGSGGGSKPKQEKAGGGGGGGRNESTPASGGKLPQASLTVPQILPPDPKPPVIKNPALPVAATVNADPLLVPPDARVLPYGDPRSTSTTPSSGPGTGNGIGSGTGTGVGSGEGNGVGPGRGGNIGGGDYNAGGGGPGGGGDNYSRIFSGKEVSQKARVLSKPEPQYTEEARKNQITGTVVLKAVFSSSGQVTNIRAVSGLPFGLTDRAIAAARLIRFSPAQKDGHTVSQWVQLEYNFTIY